MDAAFCRKLEPAAIDGVRQFHAGAAGARAEHDDVVAGHEAGEPGRIEVEKAAPNRRRPKLLQLVGLLGTAVEACYLMSPFRQLAAKASADLSGSSNDKGFRHERVLPIESA